MNANELQHAYLKEVMSILDDEHLMQETMQALQRIKRQRAVPGRYTVEEVKNILLQNKKDIENGNVISCEEAERLMDKILEEA